MQMEIDPPGASATFRTASSYIVSAQKPTVVNGCVVGNFRNPDELDLIIARINRIEMLIMTEEGLKPYREIPIFGRIAIIRAFKAPGEKKDSLLILTCKYQLAVLGFDENGEVRTRASGSVADRVARPAETGILASIHKTGLIALRLYDGLLKIVQWSDDKDLTCFNMRFGDSQIMDFTFLDPKDFHGKPTIAYIYQDNHGRHLKVTGIDTREKEFHMLWKQDNVESEAGLLIPVPYYGGVIVIGQEAISYHRGANDYVAVAPPFIHTAQIVCYAFIDKHGERILLGDVQGKLFMLVLDTKQGERYPEVNDIKIQHLGETSIPECMVYLDNSVVFVGSRLGDSQLIRLLSEPGDNPNNQFVEVIDSFANLGPIRDLIVVNTDGQNQIVTCSGAYKEGSLRIIRSGIGIEEQAEIDLKNVRSLFTFNLDSQLDNYLVVGFNQNSHLLKINDEELEETQIEGFELSKPTLFAGVLVQSGNLLQITESSINLVDKNHRPIASQQIQVSLCSVNIHSGQILLATRNKLIYMQTDGQTLQLIAEKEFQCDISCLDLALIDEHAPSPFAAVGLWDDSTVFLFKLIDGKLDQVSQTSVLGDVLSRSVLLTRMDRIVYLMVALGNGTLHYYQFNEMTGALSEEKKATLGTRPVKLKRFFARNTVNVFACSDRPAVIFSSNQKLVFSNVNLKTVNEMCLLNSQAYPGSLVLADAERFFIGVIDDIQKLHIRSVPLGELVSRIAYQEDTKTIAILTSRQEYQHKSNNERTARPSIATTCSSKTQLPATSTATALTRSVPEDFETTMVEINSICVLDSNTFEALHVCEFPQNEIAVSLCAADLNIGEVTKSYYVVGTAIFGSDEQECKLGRICVFSFDSGKLRLVAEKEVKGCVFSIATLNGKLVCAINSSIRLFALPTEQELRMESASFNFAHALHVKTRGDLVLIGDLMRSMTLLTYKQTDSQFEETARDFASEWMTACEIIDADSAIGGENAYNLFTCYKDVQADAEDERMKFQQVGYWYLGENVNVFRRGNLLTSNMDPTTVYSNPILFGTSDGGLGVIVQLPDQVFKFVQALQKNIAKHIKNCTRVDYNDYRNFQTANQTNNHAGFVDGDLIESLGDMSRDKIAKIIADLPQPPNSELKGSATSEEVLRLIEDLSRLH